MREVSKAVCKAFLAGKSAKIGNSSTDGLNLFLHGNKIAYRDGEVVFVSDAGWQTNTTKERLNSLFRLMNANMGIHQCKHVWYVTDASGKREWPAKQWVKVA